MVTRLESLARRIVASLKGVDNPTEAQYGSWALLVEMIMQILMDIVEDCPEPEGIFSRLLKLTRFARVKTRSKTSRVVRQYGYDYESVLIADTIVGCCQTEKEEDIQAVVSEVISNDNWLF